MLQHGPETRLQDPDSQPKTLISHTTTRAYQRRERAARASTDAQTAQASKSYDFHAKSHVSEEILQLCKENAHSEEDTGNI